MANKADISVIVPIYNVEEYLEECLDSIYNQTKDNIEVILVDDGSTDSSGKIAKSYAECHQGFNYYRNKNGGLSSARNFGVSIATGKYIAFVDSDDVLAEDMYEKMFAAAERNGSDLTICNVVRFNSRSVWASNLHKLVFRNIPLNTHITECPNLINDTTSWNKLILRSFYLENNFSFPEGLLYEDIPVSIPMHVKANNVSVVESTYYYWRVRDGVSKSITQNTGNLKNLSDRIKILKMLNSFLRENGNDDLKKISDKKALEIDLMIFLNCCKSVSVQQANSVIDLINEYIDDQVDPSVFSELPIIVQEKYRCAREHNVKKLIELINYQYNGYYNAPVEEKNGRFFASLCDDLFTVESRDVTVELAKREPLQYVTDVTVGKSSVEIFAHIYFKGVSVSDFSQQSITAYLENELTGELTPLPVEPVENSIITKNAGPTFDAYTGLGTSYNYDGTGFKVTIDLDKIDVNKFNCGYNRIRIDYENRLVKGILRLTSTRILSRESGIVWGDSYIKVDYDDLKIFRIYLCKCGNFARELELKNGGVAITLEKDARAVFAVDDEKNEIPFIAEGNGGFVCPADKFKVGKTYFTYYENTDGEYELLLLRAKKVLINNDEKQSVIFLTNKSHCVRFTVNQGLTEVKNISSKENVVSIKTCYNCPADKVKRINRARLYVKDEIAGGVTVLSTANTAVTEKGIVCNFKIDFNSEAVTKNLYAGMRDIHIAYMDNGEEITADIIYSQRFYKEVITFDMLELTCYRGVNGNIRLKSRRLWRPEENTRLKRKQLTAKNYPKYRQEEIDPRLIVFESMWGGKYSCNPQHLYEYIDKNYPEYKCVWSLTDEHTPIKGNGIRVRRGSQEYFKYLATAKFFVNNVNFETDYVKRQGQIEIQTMHGTPLKTLGLEVPGDFPNESSKKLYIEKNGRWDYLLVQGRFMKDKAYDCFNFTKKILEYGYPRTDALFNVSEDKKREIKKQLNLPLDKRIILYTPTWRKKGSFDMELDIEKMRESLSDEYILLVRLHHLCAPNAAVEADNRFVFDLHSYRCVEDLYLISDILITDYSSVMFDYALLDKPMLFYTYDLEDYRDNLRGLYVDIEAEAPGPLLFNTEEVITAVKNIDEEWERCADKVKAFKDKYLGYECGNSCQKIIDEVIKPNPIVHFKTILKRKINKIFD